MFATAKPKTRKRKNAAAPKKRRWNSDAERMAASRKVGRDLKPPAVKDPARRAACEADDVLWLRTYLPTVFEFEFTDAQRYYIAEIAGAMTHGRKKCIAAPRGDGKSSIFRYLALKHALTRTVKFFLLLASTGGQAGESLSAIKEKLSGSVAFDEKKGTCQPLTPLAEDYPLECAIATYIAPAPSRARNATVHGHGILTHWPGAHVIIPQFASPADVPPKMLSDYGIKPDGKIGGIVMAMGWKSSEIQGRNVLDQRPDFVALDDLDNRDSLASELGSVAEKIERQIETNIAGLAGVSKRLGMVMLCTVPSRTSVAFRYSDPSIKPWSGVRVKRIIQWPTNVALRDQYIDLRQRGKKTMGADGRPVDPDARQAHGFYVANQAAIEAGALLSNPNDYIRDEAADGTPLEISGLEHAYNYIADFGMAAFETEYQNNPPDEDQNQDVRLTAYHVRANARSDYERYVCPTDTVLVTRGADLSQGGIYWVSVAWNQDACGAIVDFDYQKFEGMDETPAAAAERLVYSGLQTWWHQQAENPYEVHASGDAWAPDLTFIDSGWKDKEWGTQPVYLLAQDLAYRGIVPCKGISNWRPRRPVPNSVWAYPDANIVRLPGDVRKTDSGQIVREPPVTLAELHSDSLKLHVHHGLLQPFGSTGSLGVYTPPRDEAGREQWSRHQDFAHHILAEEWQRQPNGVYQWVAAGTRAGGRKRAPGRNHWFDALYYAVAARNLWGVSTIRGSAPPKDERPQPPAAPEPANQFRDRPYLATERI